MALIGGAFDLSRLPLLERLAGGARSNPNFLSDLNELLDSVRRDECTAALRWVATHAAEYPSLDAAVEAAKGRPWDAQFQWLTKQSESDPNG